MKKKLLYSVYPLITVAIVFALWWIEAERIGTELILPTPIVAVKELFNSFKRVVFWNSVLNSVLKMLSSFFIALGLAVLFAVLAKFIKPLWKMTYPIVVILRVVPTMSVILLAIIWFKDQQRPIFIAVLVAFPLLYSAVHTAIDGCDVKIIEMSKVYGVPWHKTLKDFYLPAVISNMFAETVGIMGLTVKLVIASEAVAQTKLSLGRLMSTAQGNFEVGALLAYTLVAIVISYLMEMLLRLLRMVILKAVK